MERVSLEAAAYLLWTRLTLSRKTGTEVKRHLHGSDQAQEEVSREDLLTAVKLGRTTMRIARRLPFSYTCLVQSVALVAMLRRRKIEARIRFGIRQNRDDGSHDLAHAWVEYGGRVILDTSGGEVYVPFE
jgi:hypothetical protein